MTTLIVLRQCLLVLVNVGWKQGEVKQAACCELDCWQYAARGEAEQLGGGCVWRAALSRMFGKVRRAAFRENCDQNFMRTILGIN